MLHLLGKGIMPEWNDEKHDRDEVFAYLCYRGIHYAKTVYIDFTMEGPSWFLKNPRKGEWSSFFCLNRNKTSPMKPSPREIKEAKKAYYNVVDHLISENYAKSKEDADQIISGMSEDWYYMILQS